MTAPQRVYLDYNATAPLRPCACDAMAAAAARPLGNPSSPHREGREAHALLDEARQRVAALLGAKAEHVVFTSGGTEAVNAMMVGAAWAASGEAAPRIAITATDHACVRETAAGLQRLGCAVDVLPVDTHGRIEQDALREALGKKPICVVLHWANNETGVRQDVNAIGELCMQHGVACLVDAVQVAGKVPVDFEAAPLSALAVSAHKIGGPAGVGALVLDPRAPVAPYLRGGHQEYDRRAGTEPLLAAVGFGAAAVEASAEVASFEKRVEPLCGALRDAIKRSGVPYTEHGTDVPRIVNTLNVHLPGYEAEALVQRLDLEGVAVGTGAACASGAVEASSVLLAMGLSETVARESVRFSMGYQTTADEIARAGEILRSVLREWSAP